VTERKTPDFRELVGEDLPEEERARLERVHDLLVAAGPPPELPPSLAEPTTEPPDGAAVSFLPRRRIGAAIGLAAAVGLVAFLGGFIAGRTGDPFPKTFEVPMHGTALAPESSATIQVGKLDESGNWPLKVIVRGLKPLPKGSFYEMYLSRKSRPAATCGTFTITRPTATVRLNAPYNLRTYDGWIVTRETEAGGGSHPVVLRTKEI
jgi:hypothetical protein